jgi:hypothetical protein
MNPFGLLFSLMYEACERRPGLRRMLAEAAQEFNDRMAAVNGTEAVQALRQHPGPEPERAQQRGR